MTPKKLLVLDVNGLLVDTYFHKEPLPEESPDARVGNFYVYKRPFCDEFLHFCLDNFMVGIWSSAREYNVNNLVDYVFGDSKEKLAFSWHQSDCTDVGLKAPDNQWKPLFLKELSKLWRKVKVGLPWSEGDYGPSNTLLVDDTPYKAILNPPNTAIFPRSYTARDHGDNFLGDSLRSYLEGIRDAASVQIYVESNPFGEPSITPESPLWSYVGKVLLKVQSVFNNVGDDIARVMPDEAVCEQVNKKDHHKRQKHRKHSHYSDSLQLENNHAQSSDRLPSEAVELQCSENTPLPLRRGGGTQSFDPTATYQQVKAAASLDSQEIGCIPLDDTERVHTATASSLLHQPPKDQESPVGSSSLKRKRHVSEDVEQAQKPPQNVKEISNENLSEDEQPGRSSSHIDLGEDYRVSGKDSENRGFCSSLNRAYMVTNEQAATRTQGADKQCVVGEPLENVEHTNHIKLEKNHHNLDAGTDVHLDMSQEEPCDDVDASNDNGLCEGNENFKESCIPVRDSSLSGSSPRRMQVEESNKELPYRRREMITPGDDRSVCISNNNCASQCRLKHRRPQGEHIKWHTKRNDGDRDWKRKTGYYQDWSTKTPPFKGRDGRRHHSVYNQHPTYVDRRNARHCQQRWGGRPVDTPAGPGTGGWGKQEFRQFSNTMASANARNRVYDSPFSNQPYNTQRGISVGVPNYDEFGKVDGGGSSSNRGHHCFEERAAYESPSVWPERTEQWNRNLAVQCHARWDNMKGRHSSKAAGAANQPHRNVGDFNQPYSGETGTSTQRYRSVHPYHDTRPKHRQAWPSVEFSRNRQSQEGRNL